MDQFADLVPKNEMMPTNASIEFATMLGQTPVKTSMKVVTTEEIDDYAWYAAAAICPNVQLNDWSCKSCKKVPGSGANLAHFGNDTVQTKGFVLVRDDTKSIVVSFRGSNTTTNMLANLDLMLRPFRPIAHKGALVHSGFLEAAMSCINQVHVLVAKFLEDVDRQDYTVYVIGHSLGACMASLSLAWLKEALGLGWDRFRLITYGQLRTGNMEFAQWYDAQPVAAARVVNSNDRVPHLFQSSTYGLVHHQNEVFLNGRLIRCRTDVLEDIACSNSITSLFSDDMHLHYKSTIFGAGAC